MLLSEVTVLSLEHAVAAPVRDTPAGRPGRAGDQDRTARRRVTSPASTTSRSTGSRATSYGSTGPKSRSPWTSSRRRDARSCTNWPTRQTSSSRTSVRARRPGWACRQPTCGPSDPRKIVVDITGWGSDGPWADRKAYDLLVQCETGLVSLTGTPRRGRQGRRVDRRHRRRHVRVQRDSRRAVPPRGHRGGRDDRGVAVRGAGRMGRAANAFHRRCRAPTGPLRRPARHHRPLRAIQAGDGHTILLAIQNEPEWARFCEIVLGRPDLAQRPPICVEHVAGGPS